jgi:hypothetical protein
MVQTGRRSLLFNERQTELVEKLFEPYEKVTLSIIDSVCYRCEDFKRLWCQIYKTVSQLLCKMTRAKDT